MTLPDHECVLAKQVRALFATANKRKTISFRQYGDQWVRVKTLMLHHHRVATVSSCDSIQPPSRLPTYPLALPSPTHLHPHPHHHNTPSHASYIHRTHPPPMSYRFSPIRRVATEGGAHGQPAS